MASKAVLTSPPFTATSRARRRNTNLAGISVWISAAFFSTLLASALSAAGVSALSYSCLKTSWASFVAGPSAASSGTGSFFFSELGTWVWEGGCAATGWGAGLVGSDAGADGGALGAGADCFGLTGSGVGSG